MTVTRGNIGLPDPPGGVIEVWPHRGGYRITLYRLGVVREREQLDTTDYETAKQDARERWDPRMQYELECPSRACPGIDVDGPMYADGPLIVRHATWREREQQECPHCGTTGEPI